MRDKECSESKFRLSINHQSMEVFVGSSWLLGFYAYLESRGERSSRMGWRREWDSNPRYGFPYTRFPSVRLQPLGHLSSPTCRRARTLL